MDTGIRASTTATRPSSYAYLVSKMVTLNSDNYQLKWHSFGSHLHTSVATLFQSEQYTDTILCTADGNQIGAHRFLLSLCSVYFQNIFKVHHKPTSTLPLIVILPPEIDTKTLKTLIQYIYCGETTVSNDILENVLKAGDILKIRGLWRPSASEGTPSTEATVPKKIPTPPVIRKVVVKDKTRVVPPLEPIEKSEPQLRTYSKVKSLSANPDNCIKPIELKKPDDKVVVVVKKPEESSKSTSSNEAGIDQPGDANEKYLVIKDEPIEWDQLDDVELSENELFQNEMTIKPEIVFSNNEDEDMDDYQLQLDDDDKDENYYSPLTCELCSETFTVPADWVRHIEGHSDLYQPAKRQRRGRSSPDDDNVKLPPLVCDLCQKILPTPAEWVRHIQTTHTETELAASNSSNGIPRVRPVQNSSSSNLKSCNICQKRFPSHASMVIHARTHTGERPFLCTLCNKGFNVKSNLLRHLRTLHDKIISSTDVTDKLDGQSFPCKIDMS